MRGDSRQLAADYADELAPRWQLFIDAEQLFHCEHIGDIIRERRKVIQSIRIGNELGIGHVLGDFFVAAMQITDIRNSLGDDLTIHLQDDAQHAMRRWMRRPHVQDHLFAVNVIELCIMARDSFSHAPSRLFDLNFFNGWHYLVCADGLSGSWARRMSVRRSSREIVSTDCVSGTRTRGSRAIASLPPGRVTNGPPSIRACFLKPTSGISLAFPANGKSFRNGK